MFLDAAEVMFCAGKGGNGVVAWRREKYIPKGGPTGGNGGIGGSIYLRADSGIFSLDSFRNCHLIKAEAGADGGSNRKQGKQGRDHIVKVPCGTVVRDAESGDILADLDVPGEQILLCRGGLGGKGNHCFRSSTRQAPHFSTPGREGEKRSLKLELKLIADVGLLGFPNAGKSTLFSTLTRAPAKIGAYPFTTLTPNLGFVEFDDFSRIFIADIPGIIPSAHLNRGLGLSFLRHVERTDVLLYLIDVSPTEGRDPMEDYRILRAELSAYQKVLLDKPFLVVLNKIDAEGSKERANAFKKACLETKEGEGLFLISSLTGEGIGELLHALRSTVKRTVRPLI
jgi:GTP-binding protein